MEVEAREREVLLDHTKKQLLLRSKAVKGPQLGTLMIIKNAHRLLVQIHNQLHEVFIHHLHQLHTVYKITSRLTRYFLQDLVR